jgi:Plant mobile domain
VQTWIYEHFPAVGASVLRDDYQENYPRARRWVTGLTNQASHYRSKLDDLTVGDVCWMPYQEHRAARAFEQISLFSGYLRWGTLRHRHMPERVLRQYGYVQTIPRHPADIRATQIDAFWLHFEEHLAQTGDVAGHPSQCGLGYIEWYYTISHPYVIPPAAGQPARHPPVMLAPDPVPAPAPVDAYPRHAVVSLSKFLCLFLNSYGK